MGTWAARAAASMCLSWLWNVSLLLGTMGCASLCSPFSVTLERGLPRSAGSSVPPGRFLVLICSWAGEQEGGSESWIKGMCLPRDFFCGRAKTGPLIAQGKH